MYVHMIMSFMHLYVCMCMYIDLLFLIFVNLYWKPKGFIRGYFTLLESLGFFKK